MQQRKLTIADLAPYIAHGLKCNYSAGMHYGTDCKILGLDADGVKLEMPLEWLVYSQIQPLLRPLTQLTQTITHNGESFVPVERLFCLRYTRGAFDILALSSNETVHKMEVAWDKVRSSVDTFYLNTTDMHFGYVSQKDGNHKRLPHQLAMFQLLYSWHFDLTGLLEAGLAEPIEN